MTMLCPQVSFQRTLLTTLAEDNPDRKLLESLLSDVPPNATLHTLRVAQGGGASANTTPQPTPPGTPPVSVKKLNKSMFYVIGWVGYHFVTLCLHFKFIRSDDFAWC